MPPEERDQKLADLNRLLCRHLVVCGCIHRLKAESGQPELPWHLALFSGIVMVFRGIWFYATAGHCLLDFKRLCTDDSYEIDSMFLADHFGQEAKYNIAYPFNLKEREIVHFDDEKEGLDFGMVLLNSLEAQSLAKNGVMPLTEERWMHQHTVSFERFFLLGTPAESSSAVDDSGFPAADIRPTFFNVHPVDEQASVASEIPWLSFKIPDHVPLKSIRGMSGGPVFGIRIVEEGFRYWIVALQSRWNEQKRIAFACRLPEFSRIFQSCLNQALDDRVDGFSNPQIPGATN